MNCFRFVDLFAGIGGMRIALESVGGRCVFSSEWDESARRSYEANFGELPAGDITKINPCDIPDFEVLSAGFPCQPFSIIGARLGFQHETQGTLFFNIEEILKVKRPRAFILENVKNLVSHDSGRTFRIVLSHLQGIGYHVHWKVLNALDFGVPKKRERIIIVGFLDEVRFSFPDPVPFDKRKTLADILEDDSEVDKSLFVRREISESRIARLKNPQFPRPYISHENVGKQVTPHGYACALRAGASANYLLVNDVRRLSGREMLRLQGFPDSFKIVVSYWKIRHQCGNSVAIPMISAVAEKILEILL